MSFPDPKFNQDTGFPEPFNGDRNTTLRYPGAQVGPNACLGSSETDPSLFELRTRRSFQSQMKRIGTFRHNRHSTRLSGSFSINSALITAIGPSTAHYISSPTTASPTFTASLSSGSVTDTVGTVPPGMPTVNTSTLSLEENPRTSMTSSLDLYELAALTNGGAGSNRLEARPMSSGSSSSSGSGRRGLGRLFGRGRKDSQ